MLIEAPLDSINYQNIIRKAIYRNENYTKEDMSSPMYFIHPRKHMYFLYFDSEVIIDNQDIPKLIGYHHKYYRYMEDVRKRDFKQYII